MEKGKLQILLQNLSLSFNDPNLLKKAFVHRSYLNEVKSEPESNERLEFLGDSILSFIISTYLYSKRNSDAEGELTNLRAYIVKTESLAKASANLKLGEHLLMSKGEEMGGGRENPQLLANTYEALLGAIYLDQGLEAAKEFVHKTLVPIFAKEIEQGPPKDSKSLLQEIAQNKTKESPHYKILKTTGPDHAKRFLVGVFIKGEELGRGEGTNKQEAEEKAARQALNKLA